RAQPETLQLLAQALLGLGLAGDAGGLAVELQAQALAAARLPATRALAGVVEGQRRGMLQALHRAPIAGLVDALQVAAEGQLRGRLQVVDQARCKPRRLAGGQEQGGGAVLAVVPDRAVAA